MATTKAQDQAEFMRLTEAMLEHGFDAQNGDVEEPFVEVSTVHTTEFLLHTGSPREWVEVQWVIGKFNGWNRVEIRDVYYHATIDGVQHYYRVSEHQDLYRYVANVIEGEAMALLENKGVIG